MYSFALFLPLLAMLQTPAEPTTPMPVVVELFTSEGCSSCPPAEKLLNQLAARQDVIALSFHVDYWNNLGWKDRFASRAYTARQRGYVGRLKESGSYAGVYTPQLVVAGQVGVVGSDTRRAEAAIQAHKSSKRLADLALKLERTKRTVEVQVDFKGIVAGHELVLAVVEDGLESRVQGGENHGRTLRHDAVVRSYSTQPVPYNGTFKLEIPEDVNLKKAKLIGFVQSRRGPVVAAQALKLP